MRLLETSVFFLLLAAVNASDKRAPLAIPSPIKVSGSLNISNGRASPDGRSRQAILVNGATPGPLIYGHKVSSSYFLRQALYRTLPERHVLTDSNQLIDRYLDARIYICRKCYSGSAASALTLMNCDAALAWNFSA